MPSMLSYPRRLQNGHFTCYLIRTYHVLTTPGFVRVMALEQLPVVCFGGGRSGADQRMGHSEDEDAKTGGVEPTVSAVVVPTTRKARDIGHPQLDGAIGRPTREWETWATRPRSPLGSKT